MAFQSNSTIFSINSTFSASGLSVFSNTIQVQKQLYANGTAGTLGQILISSGNTSNVYWGSVSEITSTFQNWQVNGSPGIRASGADTVNIISSNTILITASNTDTKSLTFGIVAANTTMPGVVQLSDAVNNTSITIAATANSVKTAYDAAINASNSSTSAYTNAVAYVVATIASYATTSAVTNASATAYANAVAYTNSYAASNSYVNTQLGTKASLSGATFSGAVSGITTLSTGNTTINGFINVSSNATVGGDLQVNGNFTVTGNTVYLNSSTIQFSDEVITINADHSGTPTANVGIEVNRGSSANVYVIWNETADEWQLTSDGTTFAKIATNNDITSVSGGASSDAATAYTNAVAYAASNTYVNTQLGTKASLSGATFSGAVSGITTLGTGNTTITGFANISSTLQVGGTSTLKGISANGSLGTSGQVLSSNGTSTYWATVSFAPTIDSVLGNGNTTTKSVTFGDTTVAGIFTQSNASSTSIIQGPLRANNNLYTVSLGIGTDASGVSGEIRATGDIVAFYSSDMRLKENIRPIPNALQKVNALRGVMFEWSEDYIIMRGGDDGYFVRKHDTGVVAQEVEQVLPEVVVQRENGIKAVKYEKMIGLLIQAINELTEKVNILENK